MREILGVDVRFALVPDWVIRSGISDRALRLYNVLGRYVGGDDTCYPSKARLAADMNCSLKSVQRAAQELEKIGALRRETRIEKGRQVSNRWALMRIESMDKGDHTSMVTGDHQNENQEEKRASNGASAGAEPPPEPPPLRSAPRRRDPAFDTLAQLTDVDLADSADCRACGVALASIRRKHPDSETLILEIHARAAEYQRVWPGITLTASALDRHWKRMKPKVIINTQGLTADEAKIREAQWAKYA